MSPLTQPTAGVLDGHHFSVQRRVGEQLARVEALADDGAVSLPHDDRREREVRVRFARRARAHPYDGRHDARVEGGRRLVRLRGRQVLQDVILHDVRK